MFVVTPTLVEPGGGRPGTPGTGPSGGTARTDTKPSAKAAPRPTALRAPGGHRARPGPAPSARLPQRQHRRGGKPAPLAAAPGSHCLPFLKRPWGEDLCGISENLKVRPVYRFLFCACVGVCCFSFFPPARRLQASGIRPRYLCSAAMVP